MVVCGHMTKCFFGVELQCKHGGNMKVKDFMTTNVTTCKESQLVEECALLMTKKGFSVMPVVDDSGKLTGIITESDFVGKDVKIPHAMASLKRVLGENHYEGDIEEIYSRAKKRKLSEVMTKFPVTAQPEDSLNSLVSKMAHKNLKRIPIVSDDKIVGIVTRKDLIKAFNLLNK